MALVSPGVEVNVIDESFYTPAAAGTVPMIFVASAENKQNSSGTGIAQGTLKENAGTPYLLTSQRDLADLFGDPVFKTDNNNNPIHGGELNEYGLQAAYSALGVTNRAWVTRADIDLAQLEPTAIEPAGEPVNGTYWLDTENSTYGIFEWNGDPLVDGGQSFAAKSPLVVTDSFDINTITGAPKASIGTVGDYALVFDSNNNKLFYKNYLGDWVLVGSEDWTASHPFFVSDSVTGSLVPAGTSENLEIAVASSNATITVEDSDTLSTIAGKINAETATTGVSAEVTGGLLQLFGRGGPVSFEGSGTNVSSALGFSTEENYAVPALKISKHTDVPQWKTADNDKPTGSVWIKTTEPGGGARWRMKVYNSATQLWDEIDTPIYASNAEAIYELDRTSGGVNIPNGAVYVQYNTADDAPPIASFKLFKRNGIFPTTYTTAKLTDALANGEYTFEINATQPASSEYNEDDLFNFTVNTDSLESGQAIAEEFAGKVNASGITGLSASASNGRITLTHATGGDIRISETAPGDLNGFGFAVSDDNISAVPGTKGNTLQQMQISLWNSSEIGSDATFYTASDDEVTSLTVDDTLWYNSVVDEVDIMVHDGDKWVGYRNLYPDTDTNGPIVSASRPTSQSDGDDLVTGDIWVDTSDIENYPRISVYNAELPNATEEQKWQTIDNADQTSEDGILFADARWSTLGADSEPALISELLLSNYLDPDAPDPALYPRGMLLWNLRRSGFNVKRFVRNYIDLNQDNPRFNASVERDTGESMSDYYPHRWVTESANQADGAGSFGRKAQRKVVVQAMQAVVNSNDAVRDTESRRFNLVAAPGYSELIGELITLNFDRGLTAFILGDTPARLTPDATTLNNWATNVNNAVEDNLNGLVSRDEYLGIFYPWGFTSDNFGNNVVVPPSHMTLRTIILSDQVSFPWFAPAGTRRGGITNASSVGYVDSEGEFVSIALNEGQRDVLYSNNVNPLTFLSGAGLVNYGQKTRARGASALDRINVARLVVYLREQLDLLAKPYIFEQNDKITRDEIKQAAESLLLELVGQRALYDFLVVCDESNNTPSRIDRNELYLDIAIEPVKAVEFIYIPLRLKNTGEIAAL